MSSRVDARHMSKSIGMSICLCEGWIRRFNVSLWSYLVTPLLGGEVVGGNNASQQGLLVVACYDDIEQSRVLYL